MHTKMNACLSSDIEGPQNLEEARELRLSVGHVRLVLDEIEIQERDERGIVVMRPLGSDRPAIRTLPTWGGDAESVRAELNALRAAGRRSMPPTISEDSRDGRAALLDALVFPWQLGIRVSSDGDVRTDLLESLDGPTAEATSVIRTGEQGPGIRAGQLAATDLATGLSVGLEPLRIALGVDAVEPQADTGVVLIGSDADDRFARRGGLSRQADMIFTVVDAIGSNNDKFDCEDVVMQFFRPPKEPAPKSDAAE